ncbi:hypothetical protein PUN28_006612 [Cardiocondyla obscurior]|uniref:Uncharacterized protein n=1 Tax=Cardiocondyla obscurior TaxID=286306 RepID=A0AAW2G9H8_9HYME
MKRKINRSQPPPFSFYRRTKEIYPVLLSINTADNLESITCERYFASFTVNHALYTPFILRYVIARSGGCISQADVWAVHTRERYTRKSNMHTYIDECLSLKKIFSQDYHFISIQR